MRNTKVILLLLLLLSFCSVCSADYTITEVELTRLENNLTQLEQINGSLAKKSNLQEQQIKSLQMTLQAAETKSISLTKQIEALKLTSANQEASLQTVNKSFEQYAKEQKQKQNELKLQRAGLIALCLYLIVK